MDTTKKTPQEGPVTEKIENYTAKVPSAVYLVASVAAMATSLTLKCMGKKHDALFVGQWAAPFLLLGIYNKLVKQSGHDSESQTEKANNY
ncbi:hypothetical protein LZZ85_12640 [Terrimonas sp. NA20]|uniref:Uncharacterized protein n=1 Tax=Terrimonas ginsenosidimutans TaxID=2908004 RepID=A0ABS9KS33_9BACT|nr:hypothetical protein [Terrimonas ginsenosidimutans]MCG2615139.1 hypothetical protein [Terrimonas ginsenosidimutans]